MVRGAQQLLLLLSLRLGHFILHIVFPQFNLFEIAMVQWAEELAPSVSKERRQMVEA